MNYDTLFVNPNGRTPRGQFVPAVIVLVLAMLFYAFLVKGRTAQFCLLMLLWPAFVLHARRLHDMGLTAWIVAVPVLLLIATLAIRLEYVSLGASMDGLLPVVAVVVGAAVAQWGCLGRGKTAAA